MYEQGKISENSNFTVTSRIFNNLSNMITLFKQMLNGMYSSVIYLHRDEEKLFEEQLILIEERSQKLQEQLKKIQPWVHDFRNEKYKVPIFYRTSQRFVSRLIESLSSLKQKISESMVLSVLNIYVKEMEKALNNFFYRGSLEDVIVKNIEIFVIFCKDFRNRDKENGLPTFDRIKKMTTLTEGQKKQIKTQRNAHVENQSEKKMKNTINHINIFFKNIKCLDVNYSHFRSSFFQVRNKEDIYQQYVSRNKDIRGNIKTYSKSFQQYKNKKERKKIDRSNVFRRNSYFLEMNRTQTNFSINSSVPKKKYLDFSTQNQKRVTARDLSFDKEKKIVCPVKNKRLVFTPNKQKLQLRQKKETIQIPLRRIQREYQFRNFKRQQNKQFPENI